jgi:transposase
MGRWATTVRSRDQIVLFAPTLDESVMADHPVRVFDEVLASLDFGEWERHYVLVEGQPPIHPRVMAGVILYGLSLGIRSSRKLEDATGNRIDFIWLCQGRVIDHSTLSGFRTRFGPELKDLFRQVGKVAIGMGMANLNQVALDGTVKRANNSRFATARRASLQQKLEALDQQVDELLAQAEQTDRREDDLYGEEGSPSKLPRDLRDLQARQKRLREAMKKIEAMEQKRGKGQEQATGKTPEKPSGKKGQGPADFGELSRAVPTTDPDSSVLPNKAGGFAPNYTLVAATETKNGFIVDDQVVEGNDEAGSVLPAVKGIEENFGQRPAELLADSGFNTGANLQDLAAAGTVPLMPARQQPADQNGNKRGENPALRPCPSEPLSAAQQEKLPINPQLKVLDKSAFVYDAAADGYHCPMGKWLAFAGTNAYVRDRVKGTYRIYESVAGDCGNCPLAKRCLPKQNRTRRVVRDEYEPLREEMAQRMRSAAGRGKYRRRSFLCETPFAVMSTTMNVRQLLLRGMSKVKMEWSWICSAYNLRKLVTLLQARAPTPASG